MEKMKIYLLLTLLTLLIFNTLYSQTTSFTETSGKQLDYYKSHLNDLKDDNVNNIFIDSLPADLIFTGEAINSRFGFSVSTAGDVNGDGYPDVIVGAYAYNSSTGRAMMISLSFLINL